jgi:hypothetical protein
VLEEMRKAGSAWLLVLGSDVKPEVDGHDWQPAVLMDDDAKAVVEGVLGKGNVHGTAVGARR